MLKDWKKNSLSDRSEPLWKSKKTNKLIGINKTLRIKNNKVVRVWIVTRNHKDFRTFKTKAKALTFAKSYMRKH